MEQLTTYQQLQQQFQEEQRERAKRQYLIINPHATSEELDAVLDRREDGDQLFAEQVLQSARYGDALRMQEDVQSRHRDIVRLGRRIEELQQMFTEMQMIVEQQGDLVLNVVDHVDQTAANTRSAAEQMALAVKSKKASRKRRWMLCICCVILLAVLAIVLYIYLGPTIKAALPKQE